MIRALLIAPIGLLISAGAGIVICRSAGWNPHPRELLFAAIILLIASVVAMVPLWLARGADQASAALSGLVATSAHLLVAVSLAACVLLAIKPALGFVYWLLTFYWVTLIGVVIAAARRVKSAPPVAKASPKQ